MKKLTKTLSLLLVIAMIVSLCVVGVSAKTFSKDGDKITKDYAEAVDVMSGIGIIEGTDTAGTTFNPTGNFTRAAAAKIIAYMQLGVDAASALKGTGNTFKDVPASNWAAPYINYCAQKGIIAGYGNGNFGPNDTLTGYAWAKMLLCAVGYGTKGEYSGSSWSINVAKDALTKGVFENVLSASTNEVITREQATQMAFNTLTNIPTVTYSSLYGDYITGATGVGTTSTKYTLGWSVYKLDSYMKDNDLGLGGHYWSVGGAAKADKSNVVSSWYQDDVVLTTWTELAKVTGSEVYNTYVGNAKQGVSAVYVNGTDETASMAANVNAGFAAATKGDTTPFAALAAYNGAKVMLVDSYYKTTSTTNATTGAVTTTTTGDNLDGKFDKAILTVDYLAKLTAVKAETSTADAYLTADIYASGKTISGQKIYTKDYDVTGFAKGDYILITPSSNDSTGFAAPLSMTKVTPVTSAVDSYVSGKSVTFGGKTYTYSVYNQTTGNATALDAAAQKYSFTPSTYDFYLNSLGQIIGVKATEVVSTDFVYIAKVQTKAADASLLTSAAPQAVASAVFTDGTVATINLSIADIGTTTHSYVYTAPESAGTVTAKTPVATADPTDIGNWFAYVKNTDGTYTLSQISSDYAAVVVAPTLHKGAAETLANKTMTSATVTTIVSDKGVKSSFTGLATADTALTGNVLVTYAKSASTASAIYAADQTVVAKTSYAYAAKDNGAVKGGESWTFFIDGKAAPYTIGSTSTVTKGGVYTLTQALDGTYTAAAVSGNGASAATPATVVGKSVAVADTTFFQAGDLNAATGAYTNLVNYYYYTGCPVYDISAGDGTITTATVAAGDTVTFVWATVSGTTSALTVYITAHA